MATHPENARQNTLRLGQRELHQLLESFEQNSPTSTSLDREYVRWSYRVEAVELVITHSTGNRVTLPVATRNISRGGISILHSAFIHPNTQCEINLKIPGGKQQTIAGTVTRCSHLTGRIHDIGIRFREQISTKDLLGLDPLNGAYSLECVEPGRLHGSLLLVTPSSLDRELLLMYMEDTNLAVNTADNIDDAITRAQKGCDLIIADYHLGDKYAPDLIRGMREAQCDMPCLILTSDKSESALDSIRDSGAAGMLTKPTTKDKLFQALAEFLHADGDGGPLYTSLSSEDAVYPLLIKFVSQISRMALNLEKALREDDQQGCMEIVRTLSGTAAPLGFPVISTLAMTVERKLAGTTPKAVNSEIRSLIIACRRIKARPAA